MARRRHHCSWASDGAVTAPELTTRFSRVTNVGTVIRATVSRDGRSLAYAVSTGTRESLWLKSLDSARAVQLIEPAAGTYRRGGGLSYAPNGWVYYAWFRPDLAAVGIFRISQQGGRSEPLPNVWDLAVVRSAWRPLRVHHHDVELDTRQPVARVRLRWQVAAGRGHARPAHDVRSDAARLVP